MSNQKMATGFFGAGFLFPAILVGMLAHYSGNQVCAQEIQGDGIELLVPQQGQSKAQDLLDEAMSTKLNAKRVSDLEKVIQLCEECLDEKPEQGDELFARELLSSCHYEKAQRVMRTLAGGRINLATYTQRRQSAIDSLAKAIEANPESGESHLLLGQIQELPGGDMEAGKKSLKTAIEYLNDDPRRCSVAWFTLASFTDDLDKKLEGFNKAIGEDAENLDAWRERGRTHLLKRMPDKAVQDFLHLIKKDPEDVESLEMVAQILSAESKHDEAMKLINDVISENPGMGRAYTLRSGVHMMQGNMDEAQEDLDKALEIDPSDVTSLLARSRLSEAKDDFDEAMADVNRVLELEPRMPEAFLLRSSIASSDGDYRQAISDLRQLLRLDPGNQLWLLQIANIYLADSRPSMAIDTYDQILKKDPEAWEAMRGKADALLSVGDHQKAVEQYERILKKLPEDSASLNNLAWVLATSTIDDVRNGKRSIELAEQACKLTDYEAPHILSTLAAGYAELGEFEKARDWSAKAVKLGEGEIKEQLKEELESYKTDKPWRERQQAEKDDDLSPSDLDADN